MSKYSSLSEHLSVKLDAQVQRRTENNFVNEGFFDMFGNKEKAKGLFGVLGSLFDAITGDDNKSDKLKEAMKANKEKAKEGAKKRQDDLKNSAQAALIAKINARHEQRENQLNIANKKRVNAYKALERQYKEEATFWKKNAEEYTAEEIAAMNRISDKRYRALGVVDNNELQEFHQLFTIITTDNDGNTLSVEEIRKKANAKPGADDYDAEFIDNYKRFTELGKKYNKPMIDGMSSEEFYKEMEHVPLYANEYQHAKEAVTAGEQALEEFERKSKLVSDFKDKQKKHNEAKEAKEAAEAEVSNFGSANGCKVDANGKVSIDDDYQLPSLKATTSDNNNFDLEEHLKSLKKKGVPKSVLTKLRNAYNEANSGDNPDPISAMNDAATSLTEEDNTAIKEGVVAKLQEQYDAAKSKREAADTNLSSNPEPSLDDTQYAEIKDLEKEGSNGDFGEYDVTTEAGKAAHTEYKNGVKEAKKQLADIEKDRAARKEVAVQTHNEYKATREGKMPEELRADVEKATKGVALGETKNNGEIGIWYPSETAQNRQFLKKPAINASEEEKEKYKSQREEVALNATFSNEDITTVKKNPDYDSEDPDSKPYIKITKDENGNDVKTPISKEEAINICTKNDITARHEADVLALKQQLADKISACIKDGDLDSEAYKKLSKNEREILRKILSGETDPKEMFKGVDTFGSATIDKVNAFKKAHTDMDTSDKGAFDEYMKELDDEDAGDEEIDDNDKTDDEKLGDGDDNDYEDESGNRATHPAKIWKRRKLKNRKGSTKAYYNSDGASISAKDYKKRLENYKKAKAKGKVFKESFNYVNLGNHLFESIGNTVDKYSKLQDCILNKLNS